MSNERRPRRVDIVAHTHWDREWYAPFPVFRHRLVGLLDELLDLLESEKGYEHFLLDGQMAVVDDYLEIRPEQKPRLTALARAGRLAMGPWYVLMDEFLCSPETIIRNLQLGLARAHEFGGESGVGYLPDMFGHIAQMPQILRQAGFEHAVVWRGVPRAVNRTGFWWDALDGSRVRAQFLPVGYANGAMTPNDPAAFARRLADHEAELGKMLDLTPDEAILWMNGTDHQLPQPWVGSVADAVNVGSDRWSLRVTSLSDHVRGAPTNGLPTICGELRSGAGANLLMGVVSNRVDIRVAAARAEVALERRAEPFAALFLAPAHWPARELAWAWREVIRNSAHDSVGACSHDDVGRAVMHRYGETTATADEIARTALTALARSFASVGAHVVNPSHRTRSGIVEILAPGEIHPEDRALPQLQVLQVRPTVLLDTTLAAHQLATVLGQIRSQAYGESFINAIHVRETDHGLDIEMHADAYRRENLLVEEIKRDLYSKAKVRPDGVVRVRITQPPTVLALARVTELDGFGWRRWTVEELGAAPVRTTRGNDGSVGLDNQLLGVAIDATSGTLTLQSGEVSVAALGTVVDDGDYGDTYNYSPPDHDKIIDAPSSVSIEVEATGPLVARAVITRRYEWPFEVCEQARTGQVTALVRTSVELRAGESFVRMTVRFVNPSRDHRVRLHFPLPQPSFTSEAECAFAIVERGLEAEGGPTERALPTYPSRRFVRAGGLTVVHEGVGEYELIGINEHGAHELAFTLLRSTGMLSRVDSTNRPLPAGPADPLEGPQLWGQVVERRLGLGVGPIDPFAVADDLLLPLEVVMAMGGGTRPPEGRALEIRGAEVSGLRRTDLDGSLEVRVWNPTGEARTVTIPGRRGTLVDLRGAEHATWSDQFELGPWAFATALMERRAADTVGE